MSAFVTITCCSCGIDFGMPTGLHKLCRSDSNRYFYCPSGHPQHFTDSEEDKLRRERDRLKQQAARLEDEKRIAWNTAIAQRERALAAERSASAMKGQVTRLKKRAANGVCPCCNRTFVDLQRHMATKHAEFVVEEVAA